MFRYVKLKNYRSLTDFQVDLTGRRGIPKKLILVYGENGVGKSNFASSFYTLYETIRTKSMKEIWETLREKAEEGKDDAFFRESFIRNFKDTEAIIKNCKTYHSKENMVLEYGFRIGGKNGSYRLELDDKRIVSEYLEFVWNKNQTVFFDLSRNSVKINRNIFKKVEYLEEISSLIDKYWGKHSLLSILAYEIEDKKDGYVKSRINKGLYDVISYFMTLSIGVKDSRRREPGGMGEPHRMFGHLESGIVGLSGPDELDKTELFLNEFFTSLYSDVKQVYYKKEIEEGTVRYRLFFKKLIYNQLLDIDFAKESTGTRHLLDMIPFFMASVEGRTAVLDEMDMGIHDLLICNILENLYNSIEGQIIITTHNTMLLESGLSKECVYIFNVDEEANKELLPLRDFEERIHPNLNIRKRYLKGLYGGIPDAMDVDFNIQI